ncbi:type 1 fimbrial protein [Pseudomonas fluorescens]|nr:type 1 fimbrial protein [Pseudomonas fluorescens]
MKSKFLIFATICVALGSSFAQADNPNKCYWWASATGSSYMRTWNVVAPSQLELRRATMGSVMASSSVIPIHTEWYQLTCPFSTVPVYRISTTIEGGELEDGFNDVYKTGIPGIGVRLVAVGWFDSSLPFVIERPNRSDTTMTTNVMDNIRFDFIRTLRDVTPGQFRMNFTIKHNLNGWDAAQIKISGTTTLTTQSYFSGCTGVERLNIPMGRVSFGQLGEKQKAFNLDVLCSGMAAGTKVPVKVYFEGDSDGPGRLNLEPGGAQGVEISLLNDRGLRLPFSQGSAMQMTWTRSQPNGELYRLPVVAEYARKASEKIEAGKANGTLNYILEYN